MAKITFEPPATRAEYVAVMAFFSQRAYPEFILETCLGVESTNAPCDLTLDPTRPETWARAVYEAGMRDGVSRQPAENPPKLESKEGVTVWHWRGPHGFIEFNSNGRIILNGTEYRPVT